MSWPWNMSIEALHVRKNNGITDIGGKGLTRQNIEGFKIKN